MTMIGRPQLARTISRTGRPSPNCRGEGVALPRLTSRSQARHHQQREKSHLLRQDAEDDCSPGAQPLGPSRPSSAHAAASRRCQRRHDGQHRIDLCLLSLKREGNRREEGEPRQPDLPIYRPGISTIQVGPRPPPGATLPWIRRIKTRLRM